MKLPTWLKPRLTWSVLLLIACGLGLFKLGYHIGALGDQEVKKREELIYNTALTVGIPIGGGVVWWFLINEIRNMSKEEIDKVKKESDQRVERFASLSRKSIEQVEKKLEPLKNTEEIYKNCLSELGKSKETIETFQEKDIAAQKISTWISSSRNRMHLLNEVVKLAQGKHSIPQKVISQYRLDIAACINWLGDSITRLGGYAVSVSSHAKAINDLPDGFDVYQTSLNAIKYNPELAKLSGGTNVVEDFVDELIARLDYDSSLNS